MKIYTEVNYEFKDGSLVEQSSKFYNYEGEIAECKAVGQAIETMETGTTKAKENIAVQTQSIKEGPAGGVPKKFADTFYGGDLKAGIERQQQNYRSEEGKFHEDLALIKEMVGYTDKDEDEDTADDGTILTTPEEKEAVLQQGIVEEGGRKKKYGRDFMAGDPLSASILAP